MLANTSTDAAQTEANGIRLLLVDDDPDYIFLVKDILDSLPMSLCVKAVTSIPEATANFIEEEVDICICDYMLGAQTGLDLLRHAKEVSSSIPVIILTNHGDVAIDLEAMKLGAMDYLPKEDLSPTMLDRAIRYALERQKAIRERLRLEAHLRQSQKMETIGTLAGGIAHDFNNILTPILAYTDMLLARDVHDTVTREDLKHVMEAAIRAKDLVRQILTFSRQSEQQRIPIMPAPFVQEALKLLRASLPTTVKISESISINTRKILADPTHLHQIVMNLGTNAAWAMKESGGTLEVSLEEIELQTGLLNDGIALKDGSYIKLTVSDTGCGMGKHTISRIYEPFFTTKGVGEGTGLGLAVVLGIVKSYGGDISVSSTIGKGTKFEVYFPCSFHSPSRDKNVTTQNVTGHEHILLVDDEPEIVTSCARALAQYGYRVTARTSGFDALQVLKDAPDEIDIIITDYTMPELTGIQLADLAKEICENIKVILATGNSFEANDTKLNGHGIHAIVSKPAVGLELATAVRDVLDSDGGPLDEATQRMFSKK